MPQALGLVQRKVLSMWGGLRRQVPQICVGSLQNTVLMWNRSAMRLLVTWRYIGN